MSDDGFLDQLRADAQPLRFVPDEVMTSRLAARIRARLDERDASAFMAAWFRPLAASLSAIGLAALLGLTFLDRDASIAPDPVEVSMGGEIYSVAE